jgi:hypothetical protein
MTLKVRVDAAEAAAIEAKANRLGLSVSGYLRARGLDAGGGGTGLPARSVRLPPVERTELARLLAAIGPIASQLREIRAAQSPHPAGPGTPDLAAQQQAIRKACDAVTQLRVMLMGALGRPP